MKTSRQFLVEIGDQDQRLDIFLANKNNDLTRTFIKKHIETDNVFVNEVAEFRSNYKVKAGDTVLLNFADEKPNNYPEPENIDLEIVYEDDHLVVINKPSGMVVHPGSGHKHGTLVNALLYRYKGIEGIGERVRSGLIHRLDKETSGIILIAKTNEGLNYYAKQFSERKVQKDYLAVSQGVLNHKLTHDKHISVQNFIGRNKSNRQKFSVISDGGKFAHSEIYYISSRNGNHMLKADIKTGRTHQVRVHLASIGLPILGDQKYGGKLYKRLMLHAFKLRIVKINGKPETFISPIPREFLEIFPDIDETNL